MIAGWQLWAFWPCCEPQQWNGFWQAAITTGWWTMTRPDAGLDSPSRFVDTAPDEYVGVVLKGVWQAIAVGIFELGHSC